MAVWKQNPDLMDRLIAAQNSLRTPIDIVSFAGMCDSRDELLAHVERYEARTAEVLTSARHSRGVTSLSTASPFAITSI